MRTVMTQGVRRRVDYGHPVITEGPYVSNLPLPTLPPFYLKRWSLECLRTMIFRILHPQNGLNCLKLIFRHHKSIHVPASNTITPLFSPLFPTYFNP